MPTLIDDGLAIGEAKSLHVEELLVGCQSERLNDFARGFCGGHFFENEDACARHLSSRFSFVREADETLQIIVEHALPNKGARTLTKLQQAPGDEVAEGFVGRGTTGLKALGNLTLGQELRTRQKPATAEKFPQLGDEFLMK